MCLLPNKQPTIQATIQAMPSYRDTMTAYICGQLLIATGKETTGRTLEFGLPPAISADVAGLPEHLHVFVQVMWVYFLHTDFYEAMSNHNGRVSAFVRQIHCLARSGCGDKPSPLTLFAQQWLETFGHSNRVVGPYTAHCVGPKNADPDALLDTLAAISRWSLERHGWVDTWPALPAADEELICLRIAGLAGRANEREETLCHYITTYTRMVMLRPATRDQMRRAFMEYMETPAWRRRGHVKSRVVGGIYRLDVCEHLGVGVDAE
jgi:hypothetical protein